MGGALHCGKATLCALFLSCLNYHNQISIKDNSRGDAYGCVYHTQPECAEGLLCPHAHFWVHCIYTPEGIKSVRSIEKAVVGLNSRTGSRRYPLSFCIVGNRIM